MVTPPVMIFPAEGQARLFTETCPFCIQEVYLPLRRDSSQYFLSARSQSSGRVPRTGRCLASIASRVPSAISLFWAADGTGPIGASIQFCLPVLRVRWLERKSRVRPGVGTAVELLSSLQSGTLFFRGSFDFGDGMS